MPPNYRIAIGASVENLAGMKYWLVKQEPEAYSWTDLVRDGCTAWTGIRNFQARNNLRGMRCGDLVLFYHSVTGKAVVGVARVAREAYPDPTAKGEDWACVDIEPIKALPRPVSLEQIKSDAGLADMLLVRQSRLSVMPVTPAQYRGIMQLAGK